jgi:predicted ATPase
MRIKRLEVTSFKNLRNFSIDFDVESFTTVVVGENGAGKSNILEALVIIFRDLDLGLPPEFPYQLTYQCRGHEIRIDAKPSESTKGRQVAISVDGEKVSFGKFVNNKAEYLPKYVFGYYSGPSNRLEEHFTLHQQRFYRALLDGDEQASRPLLYARHVHSQFVLLGFFNERDEKILGFLQEHLRIESFDSVLFVMSTPSWYNASTSKRNTDGDPRFWYARGTVKHFLDKLHEIALVPMRRQIDRTTEHFYLYLPNLESLHKLYQQYGNPQSFFKALESTYISELINEVRIRVRIRNTDQSLTFRELSEGEQQLLMVLGLLRFTKEDESLFLLDEPDTHLNPGWSRQYINLLGQVVGEEQSSQILMTTHDPLVIAGLDREAIRIVEVSEDDKIVVVQPEYSPKQMGYPEILTSDLFKLPSTTPPEFNQLLDEKRRLLIKDPDKLTDEDRKRLAQVNHELEPYNVTSSIRDPLYELFVDAYTRRQPPSSPEKTTFTREEIEQRKQLADEIMASLLDELTDQSK